MAVPSITVVGTVISPAGAAATRGTVTATLRRHYSATDTVTGTTQFRVGPGTTKGVINASGVLKAADGTTAFTLVPNASMTPSGGRYYVHVESDVGTWDEVWNVSQASGATPEWGDLTD